MPAMKTETNTGLPPAIYNDFYVLRSGACNSGYPVDDLDALISKWITKGPAAVTSAPQDAAEPGVKPRKPAVSKPIKGGLTAWQKTVMEEAEKIAHGGNAITIEALKTLPEIADKPHNTIGRALASLTKLGRLSETKDGWVPRIDRRMQRGKAANGAGEQQQIAATG